MTWRVVYTKAGAVFPDHHDFAYRKAADDWDALCRAGGWETEVVEIGGDADSGPSVAVSRDAKAAAVPEGHQDDESAANPRVAAQEDA